ncbi:MAG: hypothetical protein HWD86_02555 [Kangiellaceae bacterium]|nr:hypothetical protein [Kangiellaceae bacterium]
MKKVISLILFGSLFFTGSVEADVKRSCDTDSLKISAKAKVGSIWEKVYYYFPESYYKEGIGFARVSPEKARKKACERANEISIDYALSMHTYEDMAKMTCLAAQREFSDRHSNAGEEIELVKIWAGSSREYKSTDKSLGGKKYRCADILSPSNDSQDNSTNFSNNPDSQFCRDYAKSAINMDKAIEALGCSVQHHSAENHQGWCSKRSSDAVLAGIKAKRNELDVCLNKLPMK